MNHRFPSSILCLVLLLLTILTVLSFSSCRTPGSIPETETKPETEFETDSDSESKHVPDAETESESFRETDSEAESGKENESRFTDYTEQWRPQYHYSAADSWINDPNGLIYYKGVWHMYYQSNPHVPHFGNLSWGHATSTDLVHWTERDWALVPDDVGMIFSGTAVADTENRSGLFPGTGEGIIVAYSTSTQKIGFAYSTDGYTYTKFSETEPILDNPGVADFRDPHLFWYEEGQKWIMAIAGGYLRIYESEDLSNWTLCSVSDINTECPCLFPMTVEGTSETKWILTCAGRTYYVGEFDGHSFTPETSALSMNAGPEGYAGITFANVPNNRTVMISWLNMWNIAEPPEGIWNGCMTLPQELELVRTRDSYRLHFRPVKEVSSLRGEILFSAEDLTISENENPFAQLNSNTFEMILEPDPDVFGFELSLCIGNKEATRFEFDFTEGTVIFSRMECTSSDSPLLTFNKMVKFPLESPGKASTIRVFADVSNVELYIGDEIYFSARIQPLPTSQGMELQVWGDAHFRLVAVYEYPSIWSD